MLIDLIGKLAIGMLFMGAMSIFLIVKFDNQAINLIGGRMDKLGIPNNDAKKYYRKNYNVIVDIVLFASFLVLPTAMLAFIHNSSLAFPLSGLCLVLFIYGLAGKIRSYVKADEAVRELAEIKQNGGLD